MAHQQEPISVKKDTWSELTNADVAQISFQVLDGEVEIRRGTAVEPDASERGWIYPGGTGEQQIALSDISVAPGNRVWAKGRRRSGSTVLVDHA